MLLTQLYCMSSVIPFAMQKNTTLETILLQFSICVGIQHKKLFY